MAGNEVLYLDNGATSFPKPDIVVESYSSYLCEIGASPSRGGYKSAIEAGRVVFQTRKSIAELIGAKKPSRIIFTKNATEALNLAIFGLLRQGDRVVTTRMEHNAVIRPLLKLERDGVVKVFWARTREDGRLDVEHLFELAEKPGVKMVITTGMSNVTGVVPPLREIGSFCRERDIIYLVDGAQLLGSYPVNVEEELIDMLAFTGHKAMYGVPGTGGLFVGDRVKSLKPMLWGGTGGFSELPEMPDIFPDKFEAGTPNTPGIAALGAGVRWVMQQGVDKIRDRKSRILRVMLKRLGEIPGVKLFGPTDEADRGATIPFTLDEVKPQKVAQLLWKRYKIAVRAGLHCAPHIHQDLGAPGGTVRFSFGALNSIEDAHTAAQALQELVKDIIGV